MIRCFSDYRLHNQGRVCPRKLSSYASPPARFLFRTAKKPEELLAYLLGRPSIRPIRSQPSTPTTASPHMTVATGILRPNPNEPLFSLVRTVALAKHTGMRLTRPTPGVSHQTRIRTPLVVRLVFPPEHFHPPLLCSSFRSSGRALRIVRARQHGSSSSWYAVAFFAGRHKPHVAFSCVRRRYHQIHCLRAVALVWHGTPKVS